MMGRAKVRLSKLAGKYNSFQDTRVYCMTCTSPQHKYLLLSQKLRYTTKMSIYLNAATEVLLIFIASQNMFNKTAVFLLFLTSSIDSIYMTVFAFQKSV